MTRDTRLGTIAAAGLLGAAALMVGGGAAGAAEGEREGIVRHAVEGAAFEDVRQDVADAIIGRGLVIDYEAHIGDMLNRTAADVGAEKQVYAKADALQFCSATLSRRTMEADPANVAFCPYVVFVYQLADAPDEVVVGYRRLDESGSDESRAALADVNRLLDEIVQEAAGG